jgi:hypothetical protein
MKIIDDLLPIEEFTYVKAMCMNDRFTWQYYPYKVSNADDPLINESIWQQQFVHMFYRLQNGMPSHVSDHINFIMPILDKINPLVLLRAKMNMTTPTPEINNFPAHVDGTYPFEFKTAVYYINTNNGYTEFETGEKVESVENRLVIFDGKTKHFGTSSTDSKRRVVLNLNYIENNN